MAHLLLVDTDPTPLLGQLGDASALRGIDTAVAHSVTDALAQISADPPEVVLLDPMLSDPCGLELSRRLRGIDDRIPLIFITGKSNTDAAIEAMRHGAYDYLFKPVDTPQLEKVVEEAMELRQRRRAAPGPMASPTVADSGDLIIGRCPAMLEVYKEIGRVADQSVIVLVTGESGTGKELVARAIHQHSDRSQSPFLAINCAAIPESLLESELFGHEKGSFTGADRRRLGKFEQCTGGTLFLDEIGDMPLATQGKILRLVQDQRFERVGGNETIQTDVRLVTATNRDLKTRVAAGHFRPDLYYRLSVFTIHLPPLRQRGNDLELLVDFYVRRIDGELKRNVTQVDPRAIELLRAHDWPGNVRELQSVLQQALLRAQGRLLLPEFLPELAKTAPSQQSAPNMDQMAVFADRCLQSGSRDVYAEAHRELDRMLLPYILQFANGNQLKAAGMLGIARQTLRTRMRELGLGVIKSVRNHTPIH